MGTHLAQLGKLLVYVGACAEIDRPYQVFEAVVEEVRGPVALEQGDFVAEIAAQHVAYLGDVWLVGAIRAVLVLDLHHYYRASVGHGEVAHLCGHGLLELVDTLDEIRVLFPQADVLLLEQPPGQSSHLPFGTHIGAGT